MRWKLGIFILGILLISSVYAVSDTNVFQGQYFEGTEFQQGTFEFKFDIYTGEVFGDLVYTHTESLTTGTWGQWRIELDGVSAAADNVSKDYFMEIRINDVVQTPRRRLTHFNYLRKNVNEDTTGNFKIKGILKGNEPLKVEESLSFLDSSGMEEFSYYIAQSSKNYSKVPTAFNDSLIIQKSVASNPNDMQVCFWDDEHSIMTFCVNEGAPFRATTIRRSLQIVGNTGVKENDENFTLCEDTNYVDCSTDTTGADLFVQDDIEAQSIYANENMTAQYFIGDGSQLTGLSVIENDTLQSITDRGSITTNDITIGSVLNFVFGGFIQEFADRFFINKNLNVQGNLNVTGTIKSGEKLVCLEDGTNCQIFNISDTNCSVDGSCSLITYDSELNYTTDTDTSASTECLNDEVLLGNGSCINSASFGGGSSVQYVSFVSTVDGKLNKNDRYLALGTDGGISGSVTEMAWIIDRDMTITGILWGSKSNSRTKTSAITLMSGSNKNSLSDTSLSKDIQGVVSGSDLTFSVSLSQGDAVAIKYDSGGKGGDIEDLSITLIGIYD